MRERRVEKREVGTAEKEVDEAIGLGIAILTMALSERKMNSLNFECRLLCFVA